MTLELVSPLPRQSAGHDAPGAVHALLPFVGYTPGRGRVRQTRS